MTNEIQKLRADIIELKDRLRTMEGYLNHRIKGCQHEWSPTETAFIYEKGYTIPGDPPGTMGVDWRGPCYVEPKTTKRWKRTCQICGEIQYTEHTTQEVIEHPKFY